MVRRIPFIALLVMVPAALTGCASGLQQRLDDQGAQLQAMQAQLEEMARTDQEQSQELQALRRDMEQMGSKVTMTEEQTAEMSSRLENLSTRISLLTDDVSRLKEGGTAGSGGRVTFTEQPDSPPPAGRVQAAYDDALALYYTAVSSRDPARARQAIEEFGTVLSTSPGSDLADNAQYWVGECYYWLEEFDRALEAFRKVFDHQHTDKYDDAQLKIGITYRRMGQREEAIEAFRTFLERYPDSEYAGVARKNLNELGG
ncbi:MAG: tetratricopeptide repeat protein [bacterium]